MKTYRYHYCESTHRSYRTTAKCLWPRADWITGDGPYATLARCRPGVLTVELHPDLPTAERAMRIMASSGCGGACRLAAGRHELIRLEYPRLAAL